MNYYPGNMSPKDNPLRAADVRERNEKIVLRLIRGAGSRGLSQSEVVVATGLRAPTIFRIFSSLEEEGYVEPLAPASAEEEGRERKGRPRVSFVARADALYAIGAEFWVDRVSLGVFDFRGERVASSVASLDKGVDAEAVVEAIARCAEGAIESLGLSKDRVLGLGLGAPGQVNVRAREIAFYSRIPGLRDFPMAARLEDRLGLPVSIHNNCSIIALSEFRYGGLQAADSLFIFLLRSGVNGAFVDGGRVYLTSDGTTIESGHISVDYDGEPCACGARGCLETYVTALDGPNLESGKWLFEGLGPALEAGDPKAEATLREAALYIASAARTVSRLFRPRAFLIVAVSDSVSEALARLVRERLESSASGFDHPAPLFEARAYDPGLAQRGAADLVLDDFLG